MWKKGEIVWVSLNLTDTWIPGRILDSSEPVGVLISFFGLTEPRYVPKPCLRNFERDFGTLISDSWSFRRFVNRALRAHFWNISFGLWCPCQPPIDSPYFDRENSLPSFPLNTTDSVLSFLRDMAISQRVSLRKLAETNSSTPQILSFRRYTVDFKRSESVYDEIRQSVKVMDQSEEADWYLDATYKMNSIDQVSMFTESADADVELSRDFPCCSSEQPVDKLVQVYSWNSSIMKACVTMARTAGHVDDGRLPKSREHFQVEQSICLLNSEPAMEDIIDDTTNATPPRVSVSAHDDIIGSDASNDKDFMAKPVSFVVPEAWKTLACSAQETYAKPRNKPDSSMISAKTLNEESSDRNTFNGRQENCSDNVEVGEVSLHITRTSNREFRSDDIGIAPAEQLQDLHAATTVENQTRAVDNFRSIGVKRKARRDKAFADNSKRKKKVGQQSVSSDKALNLHLFKDIRLAEPKCLRMKFLSSHGNIPSKAELLKRFSVFGKIDPSRTDVNLEESSAKVVFLQSIDAVTAYQFARTKKFTLGRSKVIFRLDPFEETSEVNKIPSLPTVQKPQKVVPNPKSCLKEHGSVDKEKRRRNLKVKFQMDTNS